MFYKQAGVFLSAPAKPIDYFVRVRLDFYPKTNRSFDVDNRIKAILDALTHAGVWYDDKWAVEITARKHPARGVNMVKINIIRDYDDEETHENKG